MQRTRSVAPFLTLLVVVGLLTSGCRGEGDDVAAVDATASPSATATGSLKIRTHKAEPTKKPAASAKTAPSPSITVPDIKIPKSFDGPVEGGDVSWPQCPKGMGIPEKPTLGLPMPLDSAKFVILGLTNGPGFTPNPCLADQVQWVKERRLMAAAYAVNSYPDAATLREYGGQGPYNGNTTLGALSNVGYQQAKYNVATMRGAGLSTPIVWMDVEPVPIFEWSSDRRANAAVVVGAARGYTDSGFPIGVYSTPLLWQGVVGDLSLGGVPEWRAAGQTSSAEALSRCGEDWTIQGGDGVIGQWVESNRDRNITCPGTSTQMYRWFHQY